LRQQIERKPQLVINKDGNIGYKGFFLKTQADSNTGILGSIFSDLNYADMVIRFSNPFLKFQVDERT